MSQLNNITASSREELPIWVLPLAYTVILLLINSIAGTLNLPDEVNARTQRDFNAALGMPILTGYLWFAIRSLHRRTAGTIADFLVFRNRVSDFSLYRSSLSKNLYAQVLLAASAAMLVTIIYLSTEGLLALDLDIRILLLNIMAVPFWFFIWLYLMQVTTTTLLICKHFVFNEKASFENINNFKPISDFGINNLIQAILGLAIIPVFWLGKEIPGIDIFIFVVFTGGILLYVLCPVFRVHRLVAEAKKNKILLLEARMQALYDNKEAQYAKEKSEILLKLNRYQDRIDELSATAMWPVHTAQSLKISAAILVVVVFWLALSNSTHLAV